jgi:hypothetical protein
VAEPYPSAPAYPPAYPGYAAGPAPAYPATYAPAAAEKQSSVLGIVGLAIVAICMIAYCACFYGIYVAGDQAGINWSYVDSSALGDSQVSAIMGPGFGILISSLIGIVGLVISIIAAVKARGRVFGIIGIVLGIIAPFTAVIAVAMAQANGYL